MSMVILQYFNKKVPVLFMDIQDYDIEESLYYFSNCGGMAAWYTGKEQNRRQFFNNVELYPQIFGNKIGACFKFVCDERKVTVMRLDMDNDEIKIFHEQGEFVKKGIDECPRPWPYAFCHLNIDNDDFLRLFPSNHIHAIEGDLTKELAALSRLYSFKKINIAKNDTKDKYFHDECFEKDLILSKEDIA